VSHRILALAVAGALTLGLAACGGDSEPVAGTPPPSVSETPSTSPSPSEQSSSASPSGQLPTVKGEFGENPTISVPDGAPPEELIVKTLTQGDGPEVGADEFVVVDYVGVRWDDGALFDSSFERGTPVMYGLADGPLPGWNTALAGVNVGSRLLLVLPADQAFGDTTPGEPIQPGDTLVFVVDVLGSHTADETAKGEPAPTEDDSLPYVGITPKEPEIVVPDRDPSSKLISIPVVVGDGPTVQKGDVLVLQYKGVLWRNGQEFDASWGTGQPFVTPIGQGMVVAGWDKGLVGQTVGSRVLLVIPPKDGYGSAGSGEIKATDTMVFAVDILGAY
jgi:peptidylprolyl isomerase